MSSLAPEVKPCPHGKGVFATREFHDGEAIWTFEDVVFVPRTKAPLEKSYSLRVGELGYWDEYPVESPHYWSNFIDHSDDPNARFEFDLKRKTARLRASKHVRAGEEIFINYRDYHQDNPVFGSGASSSSSYLTLDPRATNVIR
ncbi:MAG: SET domain-containing protein [Thaumarchaeota archaeon]|nr:SET domain-containing protein [Nitrososphaerota archaeon]